MKDDDIYLSMLRFGKKNIGNGLTVQGIVDHLNQNGFSDITTSSTILHQYFHKIFFSKENYTEYSPNHTSWFYLRPECYMQLLEYDNMVEARKEAKEARWYAITAIVLTIISLIISVLVR